MSIDRPRRSPAADTIAGIRSTHRSLPRWKYVLFAVVVVFASTVFSTAAILGIDVYLHKRYENRWGLNVWGYRGPAVKNKRSGEARIAVLGGSTALGFGLPWAQAFPAHLERKLSQIGREGGGPVSVVNLAYNGEGAYSFRFTLGDYEYLGFDVALLYTGVNDLSGPNPQVFRRESAIFRLTGYYLMLPTFLRERALFIRYRGNLDAAARGDKIVFTPTASEQTRAAILDTAARVGRAVEDQLARLAADRPPATGRDAAECGARWSGYCRSVLEAVDYALSRMKCVLVVSEPHVAGAQREQQAAIAEMLGQRFSGRPRLRYVDLGHAVDVHDPELAFDGMHLTAVGSARIAERLVEPVLELLREPGSSCRDTTLRGE